MKTNELSATTNPDTRDANEGEQDEHVVTDPDQYLGADLFSLDVLAQLLRENHNLPNAYVEQTGGGCAVVYAGDIVRDSHGDERFTCSSGPGSHGWGAGPSTATLTDFCVGPDSEDGGPGYIDANRAGCCTLRDVAALAAAQARTTWGELADGPTLDALGLDSSLQSALPEVTAQQEDGKGYCEAANAALHAAYAKGASAQEAMQASRAAGDHYLAHHPAPTTRTSHERNTPAVTVEYGTIEHSYPDSLTCVCGNHAGDEGLLHATPEGIAVHFPGTPRPEALAEWPEDEDEMHSLCRVCGRLYSDMTIRETSTAPVVRIVDLSDGTPADNAVIAHDAVV